MDRAIIYGLYILIKRAVHELCRSQNWQFLTGQRLSKTCATIICHNDELSSSLT